MHPTAIIKLGYKASAEQFGPGELLRFAVLAFGSIPGESLNEAPATGCPWPEMKECFARMREAIALIGAPWPDERVSFEGIYYGRRLHLHEWQGAVAVYRAVVAQRRAGLASSDHRGSSYERMIEVKVSFDNDLAVTHEATRPWAALTLSPEEKALVKDPLEMQKLADALPTERAVSRFIVSSDPDEHVERIRHYIGLEFPHLVVKLEPDQERFLRTYAQHMLPRLRASVG